MQRAALVCFATALLVLSTCDDATPGASPIASVSATAPVVPAPFWLTASAAGEPITLMPEASEWENAPVIALPGANGTGCVARAVREWVRILCTGTGDAAPTGTEAERGPLSKTSWTGLLCIDVPVRRGTKTSIVVRWGKTSRRLEAKWPDAEATRPASSVTLSAPFPTRTTPCEKLGLDGRGTLGKPCLVRRSPVTVEWVDGGWEVSNGTESTLEYLNTMVYGYDAKGEQLYTNDDGIPNTSAISWSGTDVVAPMTKGTRELPVGKTTTPGLDWIELAVCSYGLTLEGKRVYFQGADGCPYYGRSRRWRGRRGSAAPGRPAPRARGRGGNT